MHFRPDEVSPREHEPSGLTIGEVARLITKAREAGERTAWARCAELLGVTVEEMQKFLNGNSGDRERGGDRGA